MLNDERLVVRGVRKTESLFGFGTNTSKVESQYNKFHTNLIIMCNYV